MLKVFQDRTLLFALGILVSLIILGVLLYFFVARPALEEKREIAEQKVEQDIILENLTAPPLIPAENQIPNEELEAIIKSLSAPKE